MNIQKQLRRYYVYYFFSCLRITDAIWVVYLLSEGYSLWLVGLAETIFHITSLICEIPSGMLADVLGRRYSLVLAGCMAMANSLLMLFAGHGYGFVAVGMMFSALGINFMSGTDAALLYDSLKQAGQEDRYLHCTSNATLLQSLSFGASCLFSLAAATLGYFKLYALSVNCGLLLALAALALQEPAATAAQAARNRNPFRGLKGRFATHLRETWQFLRANPWIDCKLLVWAGMDLPLYLTCMFLQEHLTELGLPLALLGLPLLVIRFSDIPGNLFSRKWQPPMVIMFTVCCPLIGLGTLCAGLPIGWLAVVGGMLANLASGAWQLRIDANVNLAFPSDQRATLYSAANMLYSLLMILFSPLVGALGDLSGSAGTGLCVLGGVLLLAAPVGLLVYRRKQVAAG